MLCSMSSTVLPRSTSRRTIGTILWSESVSSPEVGSSSSRISASVAKMRAIDRSFCSGYARSSAGSRARPARPKKSSTSMARALASDSSARTRPGRRKRLSTFSPTGVRHPSSTFSSTVIVPHRRRCWKVRATPRRSTWWGGSPSNSSPLKRIDPPSGRRKPVIRLNTVVFPAPLGPMSPVINRGGTWKVQFSTAWMPPKALDTPSIIMIGADMLRPPPSGRRLRAGPAQDALGPDEHEEDQEGPVKNLAHGRRHGIGNRQELEGLGHGQQDEGAHHGTGQALGTAQDDERGDEDGLVEGEAGRVDVGDVVGVEAAREGAERGRDSGDHDLDQHHVLARGLSGDLVIAYGAEHASEGRAGEPAADDVGDRGQGQGQRNVLERVVDREAEDAGTRDAGKARVAVRERCPVDEDGEDHHLEAEGRDDVVVPRHPERWNRDERGGQGPHDRRHDQSAPEAQAQLEGGQRRGIGADPVDGRMGHL